MRPSVSSRKRKKQDVPARRTKTKRRANRVRKKGDDEIVSVFIQCMGSGKSTPAYLTALGQFLCCASRDLRSIETLERILDLVDVPKSVVDMPSHCFVVEGIVRVCVSTLSLALSARAYHIALKASNLLCELLSLPVEKEEEKKIKKTYTSPLKVRFTMNDKERLRIRNVSSTKTMWDQERLILLNTTATTISTHARYVLDTNEFAMNILNASQKLVQEYLRSRTKERSGIARLASQLLRILSYVRTRQNQQNVPLLYVEDESDIDSRSSSSNNSDVHNSACNLMIRILQESCEHPDLMESSDLVVKMIRDSINIASSNYDFVNQNLSIFTSFTILNQLANSSSVLTKTNSSRSKFIVDLFTFALDLLRESVFESVGIRTGVPRFVQFENFQHLVLDKITIRSGETNSHTLRDVMSKQHNFVDILIVLLKDSLSLETGSFTDEIAKFVCFSLSLSLCICLCPYYRSFVY